MAVKVTALKLRLKDEALPAIAAIAKELLLAQLAKGIDGNGKEHRHPDGKLWDFRDSGELLDTMVVTWKEGRVSLIFNQDYATHLNTRAPLSMSPQTREIFAERITPIVKQNVTNK